MISSLESRLHALAAQELEELGREPRVPQGPVAELLRVESRLRSLFLMREHGISEVQELLASGLRAWLSFIHSDEPRAFWSDGNRPQFSEYLMTLCGLLVGGLTAAIATRDDALVAEFRSRFGERELPEFEIAAATLLLCRQLCLMQDQDFERAAGELEESWEEWTESGMVHPRDAMWNGLRGIAKNDAELVHASLRELSKRRLVALRHAVDSGLMLRSTLPVRLTLQTDSAALVSLARKRGMEVLLPSEELLTERAAALWRL
jgi:hypothetical protein